MRNFFLLVLAFCSFFGQVQAAAGSFTASKSNLEITDLYAFRSYEAGRDGFVTIIANYAQAASSDFADQFFDTNAKYEIKIDSDGNGVENQTYRFSFKESLKDLPESLSIAGQAITLPFLSSGNIQLDNGNVFRRRNFELELVRKKRAYDYNAKGPNRIIKGKKLRLVNTKVNEFAIPENLIDSASFSDYGTYASAFVYDLDLRFKKCTETAKVFVGQRAASKQINFDGLENNFSFDFMAANGQISTSNGDSVLSIALELPISCLDLPTANSVIGVWSTINYPARSITRSRSIFGRPNLNSKTDFVQVDRLAHPFVKDLVIGYTDKINFEQRRAKNDNSNFSAYFSYPALAELIEANTAFTAPNLFPRTDLEDFYLNGISALNQFTENKKAKKQRSFEALRLNTATAVVAQASQNNLGFLGADNAGYPNGRRPGDDVADIFLRTLMGFFQSAVDAPEKDTAFSDGVSISANDFAASFPYLNAPSL